MTRRSLSPLLALLCLLTFLALAALPACGVTETGNPPGAVALALTASSSDPAAVSVGAASGGAIEIERARASFGAIRFVRGTVCDAPGELELDVPAPGLVDLAAAAPAVIESAIDAGDYCRVRVRMERSAALGDAAIEIEGRTASGDRFVVRTDREPDVDVRSHGAPFPITEAGQAFVLALDPVRWMAGVDLAGATREADGSIRIEDGANEALLAIVEANLEQSLELHVDRDEDHSIDSDDEIVATSHP